MKCLTRKRADFYQVLNHEKLEVLNLTEAKCMMADKTADANPRRSPVIWELIDWTTVKRTVRRLQERIVKAFKQKDFRKVKDLQRLLRKSYHARLLAVHRVTTNRGWRTPGVDKVVWKTPKQKLKAADQLLHPIPHSDCMELMKTGSSD